MRIIALFFLAVLTVAYFGNTRPKQEGEAAAWIASHPNYDPAIGR